MIRRGKKIFSLFSSLLEYPGARTMSQTNEAIALLEVLNWEARQHLTEFRTFCEKKPQSELEEIYVRTFERDPGCCPSVGHHLFGHDRSRSLFAARLKEHYTGRVVSQKNEMPDHISAMLRSLILQESVEEARELVNCCLVPAVGKMIEKLQTMDNPYRHVLRAVLLTLQDEDRITPIRLADYASTR